MRVLTIGTFDCFHRGHDRLLTRAAEYGPLTAGVNTDRFVKWNKGREAVTPEWRRLHDVNRHPAVVEAFLNDGPGVDLIRRVEPDLLVIGMDWLPRDYPRQIGMTANELGDAGISVLFVPRTPGVSTSEIREAA